MKYRELNEKLIHLVGGKGNVQAVVHCMTRLRFTLKDQSLAKTDEIKQMEGVIDVVSNKISYQIIIGTEVAEIYPELLSLLGMDSMEEAKVKKNILNRILDVMSESISPFLPALMLAGLLSGILSIFTTTGLLSAESSTFLLFDSIKTAFFASLSVFVAVSAAKRLGAPLYLAVLLAVTLLSPTINGVEGLTLFGIPLTTTTYSNTFIPILLGIWFMGKVTVVTKKIMPKSLDYFFSPIIIMVVTYPVTLLLFGPVGTWLGDGLAMLVHFLMDTIGTWGVLALYAAGQPFLIMLGAANFIIPITLSSFATLGYDPIFAPAWIISDFAVCGAMLGYMLRVKDPKQKQFFGTISFSAFMGITEPAVFGAFVKYRRPFLAVAIGGGLGGLFAGVMQVKGYAMTSLFGIMTFITEDGYSNFIYMVIALAIGFIAAAISGYLLGFPKGVEENKSSDVKVASADNVLNKVFLNSPVPGKRIALGEISDKAFSTGALGKGIGIIPEENKIKSPIDGEVVSLFPTFHAIGIQNADGVEVLIHIGIDTVKLNGNYFSAFVKQGDIIKQGQTLIEADFQKIKEEGYDPTVIIVVTNTDDFLDVVPNLKDEQENGLLTVIL
ncbi:beta-glucoside-specific PTS transporter subunit IIABC [Lachnospiraceae bacterium ZAX-1]